MKSVNFEMLRTRWPELSDLGALAEKYVHTDPESCLVKLRNFLELTVRWLYRQERLQQGYRASIHDLITDDTFQSIIPRQITMKMDAIRIHGNRAAHGDNIKATDAQWLLKEAHIMGAWTYLKYANGHADDFSKFQLPEAPELSAVSSPAELKKKQEQLASAREELEEAQKREISILRDLQIAQEKADELEARFEESRKRGEQVASILDMNEAETRRRLIDSRLTSAGWHVGDDLEDTLQVTQEHPVKEQPTKTGDGFADYVLWDDKGQPVAVIEAKRTKVDAEKGRKQAQLYANWLEKEYGQRPVIFYTNGNDIFIWDDHPARNYPPRKLFGFYSPDSLRYLIQKRQTARPLESIPADADIAGRIYQLESIARVSERFSDRHRKALIVQATGTGKTRVAIALAKKLLDARWVKRVLFLCDRKELRKQARNAFNEFINDPIYVVGRTDKKYQDTSRIFIATYPGMMNIMDRDFDVGYFDLIIADESHRSIYNVYGDLFKYFDALQVGLTATPVDMIGHTTYGLFKCEGRIPTFEYSLETAVADGHLTPYEIITHTTQFLREGINQNNLSDDQIAELEEQGIDPNTLEFDAKAIDKAIYNRDTNRAIMRNLMENGLRDKDQQLPGKSIVFARNHRHAVLLASVFDEMYPQFAGQFCQVIDNYDPRAEQLIDDFKGGENSTNHQLTIAISVDMLDTGIDVPEVVNLVFAKPVKSKVKFWQMIGRGTRLCKNLYGPGNDKTKFRIFDHWGNFEYFEQEPPEGQVNQVKSLAQKRLEAWVELGRVAQKKFEQSALTVIAGQLREQVAALDERSIAVQEKWQTRDRLSSQKVMEQFAPQTQQQLLDEIGPLMQWLDVRGQGSALRFDMDIIAAQTALYTNKDKLRQCQLNVVQKLDRLPPHLAQVQQQGEVINNVRDPDWWQSASFTGLEHVRTRLRSIMHLMEGDITPPPEPPVQIDVREDEALYEVDRRESKIKSVDFKLYRQQVQGVLEPLFTTHPVLMKIRNGEPVEEKELDELAKLVLVQNPNVDIRVLKDFYPETAAGLDQILRTLIGMDSQAVAAQFAGFAARYNLSSQQIRFLDMLKNHIRDFGTVEMKQLFEQPFTRIHGEGITGVFTDMTQVMAIKEIVESFSVDIGNAKA
ncbi:DEAD/DEAH box helicase family protein [Endozoicomonas gorgoniicola]|uniref:DEAD/DEAH box helicase family protein n=1 Tax=Endozoicomonas gorgoniicola TaxID=1234144 RepID=A0ABT3N215_9GAMM|nr:DEAD/DEAH box helicase family protein [Endozoicomonas gorgoniicola]MCW7555672.1 DEAD/DEAH box helicase family protein [Endozoicomonas gorgoniicola]